MVACDDYSQWYHYVCVGVTDEEAHCLKASIVEHSSYVHTTTEVRKAIATKVTRFQAPQLSFLSFFLPKPLSLIDISLRRCEALLLLRWTRDNYSSSVT